MLAAAATAPAAAASAMGVANVPVLTAKQIQEQAWIDAARQYLSDCSPQAAKEITNLLKSFPNNPNANQFVGWLMDKMKTKIRADS